ncbi:calcium-binding protein, partial [Nostoc sp. KVJ20]|uniref:calcium-binding protein n=1 Tax=Nostoc sp. KVJ20 TaxID=457944 RepID=UPI00114D3B25
GGDGNDTIFLEGLNDELNVVFAEGGNDTVIGGNGVDSIDAGDGNDFVSTGAGDDVFTGEDGNDTLNGGIGNDLIVGGRGDDRVFGDAGNDLLFGVDGNDVLNGGAESDTLTGGGGSDALNGGAGADRLNGVNPIVDTSGFGKGEIDVLTGGQGRDTFVLGDQNAVYYNDGNRLSTGNQDYAIIKDFQSRFDTIELKGSASDYLLVQSVGSLPFGTSIFFTGGSNISAELIGLIEGQAATNFNLNNTNQFSFV